MKPLDPKIEKTWPRKLGRGKTLQDSGFRFRDWLVVPFNDPSGGNKIEFQSAMPELWERLATPDKIIKQDHRSSVGFIHWQGRMLVVKKFLLQRGWWWFRLTSMLFPSLGEKACRNALELNRLEILIPRPMLLMQRLRWGQVIDSWMVYPFIEESSSEPIGVERIVEFLRKMHRAGWIHGDSHPANFIDAPAGVATIDSIQSRSWNCGYFKALDVVHLDDDLPGAVDCYGREELGAWLPIAEGGRRLLKLYRDGKHFMREIIGLRSYNRIRSQHQEKEAHD